MLSLVPPLGVLLIRDEARLVATLRAADPGVDRAPPILRLDRPAHGAPAGPFQPRWLSRSLQRLGVVYSGLQAELSARRPGSRQAAGGGGQRPLDAEITGSNPIHVLIDISPGRGLYAPQTLATIADVHRDMENQPGVGNVWSLESLRRWLAEKMG